MKFSLALILALSLGASSAIADTVLFDDGNNLFARLSAADSEELYESLSIEPALGTSGETKKFEPLDGVTSIYCEKSYQSTDKYNCTLKIAYDRNPSSQTPVFIEDGAYQASINSVHTAEALFEMLKSDGSEGRSGEARSFHAEDEKAVIYCTKSSIPVGIPYGCRISIAQP